MREIVSRMPVLVLHVPSVVAETKTRHWSGALPAKEETT